MSHSPPHLSPDTLLSALKWRYATKQFDPARKIPDDTWAALERTMVLSPSSFGVQPWQFIIVRDRPTLEKLKVAAWNQSQVTDCSHFVVLAHRTEITEADIDKLIKATADAQGSSCDDLSAYRNIIVQFAQTEGFDTAAWAARQVYIALGFLMEAAALLGIDTCPMEGLDPQKFDEILALPPQGYQTTVACALGYRSPQCQGASRPKVRFPHADVIRNL